MAYSQWYLLSEKGFEHGAIKRYIKLGGKTKWERYPLKNYKSLTKAETLALIRRLNATHQARREEAEARYVFNHAYINTRSLDKFEAFLSTRANDSGHVSNTMNMLRLYCFEFFIVEKKLPDPNLWYKEEAAWGNWLLRKKLSVSTLKRVVSLANALMTFLARRVYPEMPNPRELEPIGRNKLKKRKLSEPEHKREKYISAQKWEEILSWFKVNQPSLVPNIILCKVFGLRINEVYGLTRGKLFKQHLLVDEQGDLVTGNIASTKKVTRRPVKTLDVRKVPYWNITAREAWEHIQALEPMSPFTADRKINKGLSLFGHKSHDLRRTFITDMRRLHDLKDVQLTAGHKDPKTTLGYDQDDRELSNQLADLD